MLKITTSTMTTGTVNQNTYWKLGRTSIEAAPPTKPMLIPTLNIAEIIPSANGTSFSVKARRMIVKPTTNIAIPNPWTARKAMRTKRFGASALPTWPRMYVIKIEIATYFVPNISESDPAIGVQTAPTMLYAERI